MIRRTRLWVWKESKRRTRSSSVVAVNGFSSTRSGLAVIRLCTETLCEFPETYRNRSEAARS